MESSLYEQYIALGCPELKAELKIEEKKSLNGLQLAARKILLFYANMKREF